MPKTTSQVRCHCGKIFKNSQAMMQHIRDSPRHPVEKVDETTTCSCGGVFKTKEALEQHKRDSRLHAGGDTGGTKGINCSCGEIVKDENEMKDHLRASSRHRKPEESCVGASKEDDGNLPLRQGDGGDATCSSGNTERLATTSPHRAITTDTNGHADPGNKPESDGPTYSSGFPGCEPPLEGKTLNTYFDLLSVHPHCDELNEIRVTPIFTSSVRAHAEALAARSDSEAVFTQYGLLGGDASQIGRGKATIEDGVDPRIFYNVAAPSSIFICGSQGSGKSHTLLCFLENCLIPHESVKLPRPLTAIVYHYDTFFSDIGGSPCEAAYLSTDPAVGVRVLCPPTNSRQIKKLYSKLPRVEVEELRLRESDLTIQRMLSLMAVSSNADASFPLYVHVLIRVLRDMRLEQQQSEAPFRYVDFKRRMDNEGLTAAQLAPFKQRLDILESFMVKDQTQAEIYEPKEKQDVGSTQEGTSWSAKPAQVTIVDLSCPFVTPEMACSLFNICLSLFLEQPSDVGRVVALDEAHKYMGESAQSSALTEALLQVIRMQRHLGTRVIISTQEPTISPKLLDLCSVTIVHRFTSPDWLKTLRRHLAGASLTARALEDGESEDGASRSRKTVGLDSKKMGDIHVLASSSENPERELFAGIVGLRVGEALVFSPSAVIDFRPDAEHVPESHRGFGIVRLAHSVIKVRIRSRLTKDGGRSVMAS